MSGPIVRSGPSKEFSENWDSVFSGKKAKPKAQKKAAKKKAVKKKAAKKKSRK